MNNDNNNNANNNNNTPANDNKKLYMILSYVGILWIIGLVVQEKDDKNVKFHVGQGMLLSIIVIGLPIVLSIASAILRYIPVVGGIFGFLAWIVNSLLWIGYVVLAIMAILNLTKDIYDKPLPVIGKFAFYK